eukprot:sb/3469049/
MKTRRARKKAYLKAKKKVKKAISAAPKCEPPQPILQEIKLPLSSRPLGTDTDVDALMKELLLVTDIELVVITSKHIETVILERFFPGYKAGKKYMAGQLVANSKLSEDMKTGIYDVLGKRNILVHKRGEDNFATKEKRDEFTSIFVDVLKTMLQGEIPRPTMYADSPTNVEQDAPEPKVEKKEFIDLRCWKMSPEIKRCSDSLIASSPGLREWIEEDQYGFSSENLFSLRGPVFGNGRAT